MSDVVRFQASTEEVDGQTILRLPASASRALPSRGQVAVRGTLNGRAFSTVVEPDGDRGHWMRVPAAGRLHVELSPAADWPEPELPGDLAAALAAAPQAIRQLWTEITPMARWEWVRWVNATRNPATRARRVEVTISKMQHGKRRPCCFDLASCTDPELSRGGKLKAPAAPVSD